MSGTSFLVCGSVIAIFISHNIVIIYHIPLLLYIKYPCLIVKIALPLVNLQSCERSAVEVFVHILIQSVVERRF